MFLDENTPDLRTIRRRYTELGLGDLLVDDDEDLLVQRQQPLGLVQNFPDEIQFRLIIPTDRDFFEPINFVPAEAVRDRLRPQQQRQQEQPQLQNAAVGTDDRVPDADGDFDNEFDYDDYDCGDGIDDYDEYGDDDDDNDDRYTVDTFDLDDFNYHRQNVGEDAVYFQFYPPGSDVFEEDSDDGDGEEKTDEDENEEEEEGGAVVSSSADGQSSPVWIHVGGESRSGSPEPAVANVRPASPASSASDWDATDEPIAAEQEQLDAEAAAQEGEEVEEGGDSERTIGTWSSSSVLLNGDHDGLVRTRDEHEAADEEQEQERSRLSSMVGGANWPISELGEDSERSIRLWSSVADFVPESASESESDLY